MEACEEAHAVDAGRFNGLCSHQYEHVLNGFAAQASAPCCGPRLPCHTPHTRCW